MRTRTESDRAYFARRAAEQRRRATLAGHPQAAAAHERLAELLAGTGRPVLGLFDGDSR
jgi:hypothetical protein